MSKEAVELPERFLDLMDLEKKWPEWKESKPSFDIKMKMSELAFSTGGIYALEGNYLEFLHYLNRQWERALIEGEESEAEEMQERISWLLGCLYQFYHGRLSTKRLTQRKYAHIYIEVRNYLDKNPGSSAIKAIQHVAKELGLDRYFVSTRYYDIKERLDPLSVDEIRKMYRI